MADPGTPSGEAPTRRRRGRGRPVSDVDPTAVRDTADPGDATGRNFRYQHAYGVVLLVAAKRGLRPYVAIWCEQHEDFLAQRTDGVSDGYQIKTKRPELGAWTLRDGELTKSIGRFVDLVTEYDQRIGQLHFVSNTEFDEVTTASSDEKRRGRSPRLFLQHVRGCTTRAAIAAPYDSAFDELLATCGCDADQLLGVLHRMDLIVGPSRGEFDAALSNEHIAQLEECQACTAEQLNTFRDELVAVVHRASSLQVTDPIRHLRSLISGQDPDPVLAAKRVAVEEAVIYQKSTPEKPAFYYSGETSLRLGAGSLVGVIEQKLSAAGLEDDVAYLRQRARAAEYSLLEDVTRRPEAYPELLQQIEQRVHGEASEAHLRARQLPAPYGPAMLINVQDRLRRLALEQPGNVGHHGYECLMGVVGLLTDECRIWWGPRFPISREAAL